MFVQVFLSTNWVLIIEQYQVAKTNNKGNNSYMSFLNNSLIGNCLLSYIFAKFRIL